MVQGQWPTLCDYGDALQHPGRSLYNFEDLREAEVERNSLRRPKGRAGNFAIVYKLTGVKGPKAAKFFKNPDTDRERRYKAVSNYLHQRRTGYTVGFNYHEQGVYVNSEYFPVLLMDWVEGLPLGNWFHEKATAKDVKALLAMADEWVKLVTTLQKAQIAHGNLEHGNVLVVKGKPMLVDYDSMFVPELQGAEQLERGVDAYQHPERADQRLGPNLDHFSAWIILLSLRAVAADPTMYDKYKVRPGNTEPHENLLFVMEDIHSSGDRTQAKKADIWRDLQKSPDPQVREWSAILCDCIDQPFERIPKMVQGQWPTLCDYGDALQHPGRSLYNFEDLREAEVERNSLRRPKGRSGNLAIVFKLTGAKGLTAAKFFKNPDADRERRYKAVSDYLHQHQTDYTVGFNYHEQGVFVNSEYFPVLLMDWVEGLPLGDWFHEKATAKDVKALLAMADEWVKLVTTLQKAQIAHGNLEHGNVLVVKGKPMLIDYDSMFVPELQGAEQLERGVDAYQHPERADQRLGPNLDHFSAWIILLSLRAVAADPTMYDKYKVRPGNTEPHENLLFVMEDIHSSGDRTQAKKADIWRDLQKSPDPQVREWSAILCDCIDQPFERIPKMVIDPLDQAIAARE